MKVIVSGKTYFAALDPAATDWEKPAAEGGEGGPAPTHTQKVGRGYRFTYDLTPSQAAAMLHRLDCLADCFSDSDIPEARADGRAVRRDAATLRAQVQA